MVSRSDGPTPRVFSPGTLALCACAPSAEEPIGLSPQEITLLTLLRSSALDSRRERALLDALAKWAGGFGEMADVVLTQTITALEEEYSRAQHAHATTVQQLREARAEAEASLEVARAELYAQDEERVHAMSQAQQQHETAALDKMLFSGERTLQLQADEIDMKSQASKLMLDLKAALPERFMEAVRAEEMLTSLVSDLARERASCAKIDMERERLAADADRLREEISVVNHIV